MTPLTDELLKRIRDGSGRVYTHEAKSMAAELLAFREAKAKALSTAGQANTAAGIYGVGAGPGGTP